MPGRSGRAAGPRTYPTDQPGPAGPPESSEVPARAGRRSLVPDPAAWLDGDMFVEDHVPVPVPAGPAELGLRRFLSGQSFYVASVDAMKRGFHALSRVGPTHHITKEVHVQWLTPYRSGETLVFPLRWEATGPSGRLFPTLDANLGLTPVDARSSLLSVTASYRPPFGEFGERIDRLVLRRAARATVRALLAHIATNIRDYQAAESRTTTVAAR
jgi:hypothetical protein